ncbi:hypothetical protein FBU30_004389 [Linnemannia zychae]|nr:hypothetical protein FBU30_004389 [Linnemannia zychae]
MNFVKTRDGERNPVETLDKTDNMDEDQCKTSSAKKDQGQQHDQEQICSDLGRFLSPVSHTLKHLTLLDIRGEYALDSLAPTLTETSVQSTLWFPHVVEFATDFSTKVSPGIEELIARCPNLEILRLSPHPTVSLEPLAAVLQRRRHDSINDIYNSAHHLKIHTLRIQSQTSEANQIHKVIEACENLTRLEYICNGLSEEIQKATNTHRSTLQHLKISVVFCHSVRNVSTWSLSKAERIAIGNAQIRYIQLITRSFTNLRSLAFQDAHQRSLEAEAAEILMETPWQCYNLERLHLAIELLEQEFEMDYPQPGRVFAHGWRIPMHVSVERTRVKPNYELFEQFLEHISPLPALRFIKALRVECVR